MEPVFKLSGREKTSLVLRYLRGCWSFFVLGLLCNCVSSLLGALTPQIIRISVDSVLGEEPPALPAFLQQLLRWETLTAEPMRALICAALAVMAVAVLLAVPCLLQK